MAYFPVTRISTNIGAFDLPLIELQTVNDRIQIGEGDHIRGSLAHWAIYVTGSPVPLYASVIGVNPSTTLQHAFDVVGESGTLYPVWIQTFASNPYTISSTATGWEYEGESVRNFTFSSTRRPNVGMQEFVVNTPVIAHILSTDEYVFGSVTLYAPYTSWPSTTDANGKFEGITYPDIDKFGSFDWVSNVTGTAYFNFSGRPQNVITSDIIKAKITPSGDPYGGDPTGTGGGDGDHDDSSDDIDFPDLPTASGVNAGFITLYNPSNSQLRSLASYMWSGLFDLDTFRKIFADPMDCILGLSIVPVDPPTVGTSEVKVGNISTGISMTQIGNQYVELDCGSIDIEEFWGAYLDYDPYTKIAIYLPYIGMRDLSTDDIMKNTIHVKYHVDVLSGACMAYVKCGSSVRYQYAGSCAVSVPVSGNDWTQALNGILNVASAIGTTVATGGATAPMAAGVIASTAVNGFKQNVGRSGAAGGAAGFLGIQKPYLIITRPKQAVPENQNVYHGYPAFITATLGNLSGFTMVDAIHLDSIPGTADELDEIENLLKTGVIL